MQQKASEKPDASRDLLKSLEYMGEPTLFPVNFRGVTWANKTDMTSYLLSAEFNDEIPF